MLLLLKYTLSLKCQYKAGNEAGAGAKIRGKVVEPGPKLRNLGFATLVETRVSEPACFGAAPAPGIFYPQPAPAPAPGKREHNFRNF